MESTHSYPEKQKPIVLVFVRYYLPGHKSGGPVRSISNIVAALGEDFDFRIITLDRDVQDPRPYKSIITNCWNDMDGVQVYFHSNNILNSIKLANEVRLCKFDVAYFNSYFDPLFSILHILLFRIGFYPSARVIVAPRGEFSQGALSLKRVKKKCYIVFSKLLDLYQNVKWHASTTYEESDILRVFFGYSAGSAGSAGSTGSTGSVEHKQIVIAKNFSSLRILVASDLVSRNILTGERYRIERKLNDVIRIVFISRITRKKNIDFALRTLKNVSAHVEFGIYGNIEDENYWKECENVIASLPNNIQVTYYGDIKHEHVVSTFSKYDLFFFPTRGENFGHVIAEALTAGIPVLISDQTPWLDVESEGAGWIRSLEDEGGFAAVIDRFASLSSVERDAEDPG